ncbi:MAG TPA: 1-acyl-sn-glycerol-3-phosphate acyltransferase [Deltaproteobacteria bacterium]|nr:1-acyl-sn-glycerol-3-phosphate acyltransferase [Deltaproteobacteria bacterium]
MSSELLPPWDRPPSLTDRVISVGLWGAGLAWLVPMMSVMMGAAVFLRSDRTERLSRLYCRGQIAMTGARWRAVVDPAIDPGQPYVFVCNHVNLLDHVTMYNATPHFKQGLELESHFKIPVYGWFMRQRGTIPVRRGQGRGQLEELEAGFRRELEAGHSILAFPEGTRTRDGRVRPFKRGVFHIARNLGVPIVPTTVTGMYEVLRAGSALMRWGGEVTVYCDAPIPTEGLGPGDVAELAERAYAIVSGRIEAHIETSRAS